MSEGDSAAVERIIANTIKETARGDPDALASRIVAALAAAGFRIVSAHGRENTAPGPQRAVMRRRRQLVSAAQPNTNDWQCIGDLLATCAADFRPDLKCLGPGSSMLGSSDMIAGEVEQVIDLIMG